MTVKCLKCDYVWESIVDVPKRCPRCKTAAWMTPKRQGFKPVKPTKQKKK